MSNFKDTLDKRMIAELVSRTIDTEGWQIIEDLIDEIMQRSRDRLLLVNPTDVVEIARHQEKYKTLKGLKNEIKKLLNT